MNAIVLSAPIEVLPDFHAATAQYPFDVRTTSALNRPLLTSVGANLRAVFAINITRAWSLGRLAAVVRGQNRDAVRRKPGGEKGNRAGRAESRQHPRRPHGAGQCALNGDDMAATISDRRRVFPRRGVR